MINFEIRLSISRLKKSSLTLKKNLNDQIVIKLIYRFCEYLKEVYINLVREQVNSSRYNGKWEPVEDEGYLEYLGVVPKVDILDLLRESLEVKRIGHNIYLRVNPEMRYPGSSMTVLRVVRALENGTTEFPARPILRKVSMRINLDLIDLWLDWLRGKVSSEGR